MTLDGIRCFCAVIDTGNFRLAAERVHRTQPAVSQQIKTLEREFGMVLLDRKTAKPTPGGSILYEKGKALIQGAEGIRQELAEFDELARYELRIGASDTNALYFLPPYIREFSKRMPQTRLAVITRSSDDIADEVQGGAIDLGIVTLPVARANLAARALFEQRLVLVAPRGHPLSGRKRVSLANLKDEAFVLLQRETRTGRLLEAFFQEHDFEPRVVLDSGSFEVIKRYVAEGIGLSFLPEIVVTHVDQQDLETIHVPGLPAIQIGAIWREGAYETKAAKAFLELLSPV